MRFLHRKRRSAPSIIIISLIDVLIVMVVFLLVTTTYRQQPSVKLTLPESSQSNRSELKAGVNDKTIVVTVQQKVPNFFIGVRPVGAEQLLAELQSAFQVNADITVDINADKDAGIGLMLRVWDAAKAAKIKNVRIYTRTPGSR